MNKDRMYRILIVLFLPGMSLASIEPNDYQHLNLPGPVQDSDFYNGGQFSAAQVRLGQLLFFDKILSGNKNIACATCHHPKHGTSDGVPLSLGEGAIGLASERHTIAEYPVTGRVPRNSPALYFLGAKEFTRLFHDGRIEKDESSPWSNGFWTPVREQLPDGLENILAAQAMFPVTSHVEMAGQKSENEIADAVALGELNRAWNILASRLQNIAEYVRLFKAAYAHITNKDDIRYVDAANAIAAFESVAFRADNSPFDVFLKTGNKNVLSPSAQRGMSLFYGRVNCVKCHSGKFQTDQQFHAIALPQIGPGKNDGWDQSYWEASGIFMRLEDFGRGRVTLIESDNYKFRTPSLRNVELSGPWGHAGTHDSLADIIRHHGNPVDSLKNYRLAANTLPDMQHVIQKTVAGSKLIFQPVNPARMADYRMHENWIMANTAMRNRIARANELQPTELSPSDINDLVAFLRSLTDPAARQASKWIPDAVPSGLPIDQ